jgi:hypothetical protein
MKKIYRCRCCGNIEEHNDFSTEDSYLEVRCQCMGEMVPIEYDTIAGRMTSSGDMNGQNVSREKEKILKFSERYGGICDMDSYSECAKIMGALDTGLSLTRITTDGIEQGIVVQHNITEYEESGSQDIWKWYFNQRGGSCNGN